MRPGSYHRILLIFVDGVGLAPAGPSNPWSTLPSPQLRALLGGPLTREALDRRPAGGAMRDLAVAALDARLGVAGLPQSVTGQATLFTGVNAARILGRHATGFLGPRLRRLVLERGLFRQVADRGLEATFANAYAGPVEGRLARRRRASVTTTAVEGAGLVRRGPGELARGEAVTWDVVGDRFAAATGLAVAPATPRRAGERLARLAAAHRLTVFETFLPDLAGHGRWGVTPAEAIARVDGLVGGAVAARPVELTVALTSDHGNLEDLSTRRHTLNPVPLVAVGPAAGELAAAASLLDVTPAIVGCLSKRRAEAAPGMPS